MTKVIIVAAMAILGWLTGGVARAAIITHGVPPGSPWQAACPHCGRRVSFPGFWPASSRCPTCRGTGGQPPFTVELATALTFGALAVRIPLGPALAGLCWVAVWGVALAFTDLAVHRLPNRLIALAGTGGLVAFAVSAATNGNWTRLGLACLCGLGLATLYLVVALIAPGLGLGDVKLAALIGLATGWFSIGSVILALISALMIHGLAAGVTAIRQHSLADSIAHGPSMLAGALLAVLAAG